MKIMAKYSKVKCEICNREISNTNIKRHIKLHETRSIVCPVCGKQLDGRFESVTCSYACSNVYFRSGKDNGQYKPDEEVGYVRVCFRYHDKKCIICGEDKIVAVHHYDENKKNNDWKNLVPLCPTHHSYVHSRWYELVKEKIDDYVNNCNIRNVG
jgi:hypothetical protein